MISVCSARHRRNMVENHSGSWSLAPLHLERAPNVSLLCKRSLPPAPNCPDIPLLILKGPYFPIYTYKALRNHYASIQGGHRNILCSRLTPFCRLWSHCNVFIYLYCWELMNSVESDDSLTLPYMSIDGLRLCEWPQESYGSTLLVLWSWFKVDRFTIHWLPSDVCVRSVFHLLALEESPVIRTSGLLMIGYDCSAFMEIGHLLLWRFGNFEFLRKVCSSMVRFWPCWSSESVKIVRI